MPEVPAIVHPEITKFVEGNTEEIFDLLNAFGSVVHLVFPEIANGNLSGFQRVFANTGVEGSAFYAAKANKSEAILEAIACGGGGMDVSSLYELRQALAHGIAGRNVTMSGPAKDYRFLLLGIQHGAVISIDSIEEFKNVIKIIGLIDTKGQTRITIRLGDMSENPSRFGMSRSDLPEVYELLQSNAETIDFLGFAFHLGGYSVEERAEAILSVVEEIKRARAMGFQCNTIDMGGGFPVSYVDKDSWDDFNDANANEEPLFLHDRKFGSFYPYNSDNPGPSSLASVLAHEQVLTRKSVADVLKELDVRIFVEPGRAVLDQAGITLMRVHSVKKTSSGETVVVVEGNINSLSEQWFNTDFLPDPILLQRNHGDGSESVPVVASVAGNTCMEIDMVTWHKVGFRHTPKHGDVLVYVNTAGYQMDSNETEFHRLPIPEKLAVFKDGDRWKWKRDREFSMLDITPQ